MKFSRVVFTTAGIYGIAVLTPLYFMFDSTDGLHGAPLSYPHAFFGFLAVTIAWQIAFLVIGSAPDRFRLMMIPSVVEKSGYVVSMVVLLLKGDVQLREMLPVAPDFVLGILFAIAFLKTSRHVAAADAGIFHDARRFDQHKSLA